MDADAAAHQERRIGPGRPARLLPLLACALWLFCAPALAQDAPPHEAEGRSSVRPSTAQPAKVAAKQPAKPAAKPQAKTGAKIAPKGPKGSAGPKGTAEAAKRPLRSLDANHDGRITREEYLAPSKKRFAKADTNRAGVISPQAAKDAKAKLQEKQAKSDARRRAQGKPVKARRKSAKPSKPYLSSFDADHNGRVTQKEYLERRKQKFAEMDLNHDGVISREEARIAKQKQLERRAEKQAQAKAKRLRKIEEARRKAAPSAAVPSGAASSSRGAQADGPSLVLPVKPPTGPSPVGPPAGQPAPPLPDVPYSPVAPGVPAQAEPAT